MSKCLLCFSLGLLLTLSGCELSTPPGQGTLNDAASNLRYFKDRHGLCYAALSSSTYSNYKSIAITMVPCEKVGL